MFKKILHIFIFFSLMVATQRQDIIDVLQGYNKAFGKANYSDIVNY